MKKLKIFLCIFWLAGMNCFPPVNGSGIGKVKYDSVSCERVVNQEIRVRF